MEHSQVDLFGGGEPPLPPGMRYQREFLSRDEEKALVEFAASLPLQEMNYKGYTARRRVVSYGASYDFSANQLESAAALPPQLEPLRDKAAAWVGTDPGAFTQVLVAEYRAGTPLGWHRDVPDFEDVAGVSLLGEGVMRLRPYASVQARRNEVLDLVLEPRSIYLLHGAARWAWQHRIVPARSLRYSITLRTARRRA
jgi:alkylated DNA repair dioxygenase AlkB